MKKRTSKRQALPARLPSVPDHASAPTRYDEPARPPARDRIPDTRFRVGDTKADLRLQLEQLLLRKEPAPAEAWRKLGDDGRALLVELLDDPAIRAQEAVLQRLVATVGELAVKRSVAPLAALLSDASQRAITRTYAANALGRIGEATAIPALAAAVDAGDSMIRRQVAIALGRIDREAAAPHLLKLCRDPSVAVSEVALSAARRRKLAGVPGLASKRVPAAKPRARATRKKSKPAADS